MKQTVNFIVLLLSLLSAGAACREEPEIPWDKIRDKAECYLQKFCPKKERDTMYKKLKDRAKQKIDDLDIDEDRAMREVMLEWAVGNAGKLKRKEQKTVMQACFYFVTFIDKGYLIPNLIRAQLTPSIIDEILGYLDEQTAKAAKK